MKGKTNWRWLGWALWLIPLAAIAFLVARHPLLRSMTPSYHEAVDNWWAQRSVYIGPAGFNYLPAFLPFFSLYSWLPLVVCEILWRCTALGGLGFGLWHCLDMLAAKERWRAFALVSALSLPICLSALRNGQSSALLAASLVLAAWCLHRQRWWPAVAWLSLALTCKPLAIPAIGLAIMAFPGLWWRAAIGAGLVLVCPYFFALPSYVNELYAAFAGNIAACFEPGGDRTFADLNGVLMAVNFKLTGMISLAVRVGAGAALAVACWRLRGLGTDSRRVLLWLGFTGIYIMLFTPMNEANSYVMLAPALGLWGEWLLEHDARRSLRAIVAICVSMMFLPDLVGLVLGKYNGNEFAKFWCPLMTLVFLAMLAVQMRAALAESRRSAAPRNNPLRAAS